MECHPHSPEMSHASALSLWDYPLRKPTIYQEHADPAWAQCLSSSMPRLSPGPSLPTEELWDLLAEQGTSGSDPQPCSIRGT